jgi:hypothetical protein
VDNGEQRRDIAHNVRMTPRSPSPQSFPSTPFSVGEAMSHGVSRRRLRARDLAAPFAGTRVHTAELDLVTRCRALALRLPDGAAFSHTTAAMVHGLPLPLSLASVRAPIHVVVPPPRRAVDIAGVTGHRMMLEPNDIVSIEGLLFTRVERTWCDLGSSLRLPQLVAAGDHAIRPAEPLTTIDRLRAEMLAYTGRRGIRDLRRALDLLDGRAESPRESMLRIAIVLAGLPRPEANVEIRDDLGRLVERVDLAYPALKVAIEYEGDHHRTDKQQWRKDIARLRAAEQLGWKVIRTTELDLDDPRDFIAQLSATLARRPHIR